MKGNRASGYIGIDFAGLMVGLLLVGAVGGLILSVVLPRAWAFVKPYIHAVTA